MSDPTPIFHVSLRGDTILTSPRFNKGTAFTIPERKAFGLTGRLPSKVNTLEEQCKRAYSQLQAREAPIRKNSFLQSLKEQNWVLYYTLLSQNLRELVPIIYTPTEVCLQQTSLEYKKDGYTLTYRLRQFLNIPISSEGVKGCISRFLTKSRWRKTSWSRRKDGILT